MFKDVARLYQGRDPINACCMLTYLLTTLLLLYIDTGFSQKKALQQRDVGRLGGFRRETQT